MATLVNADREAQADHAGWVRSGVNGCGIDFAHIIRKRFGCLQRRKVSNELRLFELRAVHCDLITLGPPDEGDFVCDHGAAVQRKAAPCVDLDQPPRRRAAPSLSRAESLRLARLGWYPRP